MSEPRKPSGDPEKHRTTIALTIDLSDRERRLLAARFGITPPPPDDVIRQWVARLVHAVLTDPAAAPSPPLPSDQQESDNERLERWLDRYLRNDPRDGSPLPEPKTPK